MQNCCILFAPMCESVDIVRQTAHIRTMLASQWIKDSEAAGWRVSSITGSRIRLACSKAGCLGHIAAALDGLPSVPGPCALPHVGQWSATTFAQYQTLVDELRRRRRQLGLDQGDINHAAGLADGYVNKLEAFAKIASMPTLQLWAATLGLSITTAPAPLPPATTRAIENRAGNPYQPNQARFKHG